MMWDVGVLGAVAEAVNQDPAGDGTIGTSVASLSRGCQLERSDCSGQCFAGKAETQRVKGRCREGGASELNKSTTT